MEFLLVHGTTQSPAGWQPLRDELTRRGHRSEAVDLPTDRPDFTTADYARAVVDQVDGRLRRPVAVAHSGSGAVLPAVAEAVQAVTLVWLAAYVPDFPGGNSLLDEIRAAPEALFHRDWIGVDPAADHEAARHFLFHDCAADMQRWALGTLRVFGPAGMYGQAPAPTPPAIRSTYILPTADRTLRPGWMRRAARHRLAVEPTEIDAGHCPHVSAPDVVAELLAR